MMCVCVRSLKLGLFPQETFENMDILKKWFLPELDEMLLHRGQNKLALVH